MSPALARVVYILLQFLTVVIVARAIGSFFIRDWSRGIPRVIFDLSEPLLRPIRSLLPPLGGLDLSCIVVLFGIYLVEKLLGPQQGLL